MGFYHVLPFFFFNAAVASFNLYLDSGITFGRGVKVLVSKGLKKKAAWVGGKLWKEISLVETQYASSGRFYLRWGELVGYLLWVRVCWTKVFGIHFHSI